VVQLLNKRKLEKYKKIKQDNVKINKRFTKKINAEKVKQ
jgi:hypothetical protein